MSGDPFSEAEARLRFELEVDPGFWIGVVRGEGSLARTQLREAVARWCEANALPFHDHYLRPFDLGRLAIELARPDVPAGLHWVRSEEGRYARSEVERGYWLFLTALNERREALRARLRGPLILEGPEALVGWLREAAPDIASIASPVIDPGPDSDASTRHPIEQVWFLPQHVLMIAPTQADYDAIRSVDEGAAPGSSWREEHVDDLPPVSFRSFTTDRAAHVMVSVVAPPVHAEGGFTRALTAITARLRPRMLFLVGLSTPCGAGVTPGDVFIARRVFEDEPTPERLATPRVHGVPAEWETVIERFVSEESDSTGDYRVHRGDVTPATPRTREGVRDEAEPVLGLDESPTTQWFVRWADEQAFVLMVGCSSPWQNAESRAVTARDVARCALALARRHPNVPEWEGVWRSGAARLPENPTPSQLLDARHEVVPWSAVGHDDLLRELDAWADAPDTTAAVRLLHGEGGTGKTRLAIEWSRRRRQAGWVAGFFSQGTPRESITGLLAWGVSTLIVLDYAELRPDLAELLRDLHRVSPGVARLRVLLLARNDGDWFTSLCAQKEIGAWLTTHAPREVGSTALSHIERRVVFEEAQRAFSSALRQTVRAGEVPDLGDPAYDRVLFVLIAALSAVMGWSGSPHSLMEQTLDHEEQFWPDPDLPPAPEYGGKGRVVWIARQILAAATLRGSFTNEAEARAVARRCLQHDLAPETEDLLARLHSLYARLETTIWLPGLEPDLLGESLVIRLAAPSPDRRSVDDDWIERVLPEDEADALRMGFTVMGRASATAPEIARGWIRRLLSAGSLPVRATAALEASKITGTRTAFSVLGDALADELDARGDRNVAEVMDRVGLPWPTVSLRRAAEWRSRTLLNALQRTDDESHMAERARRLNALGVELSDLGRRKEALGVTQEAVQIQRQLALRNPNAFLPDLARSLNNLGARLSELGRRREALAATQETVQLQRQLAARNPDALLPDLARSLNNLGIRLSNLGRRNEALAAVRETVQLQRQLATRNPDAFLPDLANSLSNLGNRLNDPSHREEALAASQEAVQIRRQLAARTPDAFLPALAESLDNLGNQLSDQGHREEALAASQEAVQIRRHLAARNPNAFLPDLAASLNLLGRRLSNLNRSSEALKASEEALDLLWPFFERLPTAFAPLASYILQTLTNLYNTLKHSPSPSFTERRAAFARLTQP